MSLPGAVGLALASYLLGSVPFALLIGLRKGVDIRRTGSGNVGATNLGRTLGRRFGIAAFLLDFLKGLLPVLLAGQAPLGEGSISRFHLQMACGLLAVLGHVFPVYLRFRGGKGVATGFGALAGLSPGAALVAGAVWGAIFLLTRTVSLASLAAAAAFPAATIVLHVNQPPSVAVPLDCLAAGVGLLIVVRHRSNIRRLLRGEEH